MAKKHSKGKFKPYASPGHVHDHPAHDLTDPSGGMMAGSPAPGMAMPPGAPTQGLPPGIGEQDGGK